MNKVMFDSMIFDKLPNIIGNLRNLFLNTSTM